MASTIHADGLAGYEIRLDQGHCGLDDSLFASQRPGGVAAATSAFSSSLMSGGARSDPDATSLTRMSLAASSSARAGRRRSRCVRPSLRGGLGEEALVLLVSSGGHAIGREIAEIAGQPVRVHGRLTRDGHQLVLHADRAQYRVGTWSRAP